MFLTRNLATAALLGAAVSIAAMVAAPACEILHVDGYGLTADGSKVLPGGSHVGNQSYQTWNVMNQIESAYVDGYTVGSCTVLNSLASGCFGPFYTP